MTRELAHPPLASILEAAGGGGQVSVLEHLDQCDSCQRLAQMAEEPGREAPAPQTLVETPNDSNRHELVAGTLLHDRFQIEGWIASGGMGAIYRAIDKVSGLPVAIKIATHGSAMALARFERESRLLATLRHPGLVEYVAHGTLASGMAYLAMSWLEGIDLANRLIEIEPVGTAPTMRRGRMSKPPYAPVEAEDPRPGRAQLPIAEVVKLGRRLASVLETLHEHSVIHRDIKPANVFLVDGDAAGAKLIDLGAAREEVEILPLTEAGTVVGTAYYMAPEQVCGDHVGPPVDLWAVGCVLYECLTGVVAFGASQPLAAMTRILVDSPKSVILLRPDVGAELSSLIDDLLCKDPVARPSARELGHRLSELSVVSESGASGEYAERPVPRARAVAGERWLQTFLFVRAPGFAELPSLDQVVSYGGLVAPLAQGTGAALITFQRATAPKDDAIRAAQLALALRDASPELIVVVASGHDNAGDASPVPAMLDSAIASLLAASPGQVCLDRTTARLISDRFRVQESAGIRLLVAERPLQEMPSLLGKRSPMVGRTRELAMLVSTFNECVDYEAARGILITAPAGQGKSRLRHEFLLALKEQESEFTLLVGRGEPLSAGTPFVMLAPALRRLANIHEADDASEKERKLVACVGEAMPDQEHYETAAFLGEIAGVPFPEEDLPSLRSARREPGLMAEQRRGALCRFLRASCQQKPVLLVLDDLHWGDQPSVAHVDALLRETRDAPLMVLALARPEVHDLFPQLWQGHEIEEIRLRTLPRKAAIELARKVLGESAQLADIELLVDRAEGNAFFLEELLQAAAEGEVILPDSVIAMVQARLRTLPAEARKLLLAASVFGETFWAEGASALLGGSGLADQSEGAFDTDEWLDELLRRELIVPQAETHLTGHRAYRFRHSLLREGAYAMLLTGDVTAAHRRAATWLVDAGESDARVLAGHYSAAELRELAGHWYLVAAQEALAANDHSAAMENAERAVDAGAMGEALGELRAIQTEACRWLGRYDEATSLGRAAAALLEEGSPIWYRAVGQAVTTAARRNDFVTQEALHRLAEEAPGHGTERTICLCRAGFQQIFEGRLSDADRTLGLIGDTCDADVLTRAQVADTLAFRHYGIGDFGPALVKIQEAYNGFLLAGDTSSALMSEIILGVHWGRVRDQRGIVMLRRILADVTRMKNMQLQSMVESNIARVLLAADGDLEEAEGMCQKALAYYQSTGSVRFQGWTTASLAECALARTQFVEGNRLASEAVELLADHPVILGHALALQAQALGALGRDAEALEAATQAFELTERMGGQMSGELLPGLVAAELLHRNGDVEAARNTITKARERLLWRVSRIEDPAFRASYLALPDAVRTLELAKAWC